DGLLLDAGFVSLGQRGRRTAVRSRGARRKDERTERRTDESAYPHERTSLSGRVLQRTNWSVSSKQGHCGPTFAPTSAHVIPNVTATLSGCPCTAAWLTSTRRPAPTSSASARDEASTADARYASP